MSATQERTETIEERVARLEVRLQEGFSRIGEAMSKGVAPEHWETAWIDILRQYEALQDELDAQPPARPEQATLGLGAVELRTRRNR